MKARLPLIAGAVVLVASWAGPLPQLVAHSFTAHMALHMLVVGIGVPLFAGGLGPVLSGRAALRALPAVVTILDLIVIWVWHAPALHHASRMITTVFILEQASFAAIALVLWVTALSAPPLVGSAVLFFTSMHMTLLGALLALAPRAIFASHLKHGAGALQDQQLGGVVMLGLGGVIYLGGALLLAARGFRRGGAMKVERWIAGGVVAVVLLVLLAVAMGALNLWGVMGKLTGLAEGIEVPQLDDPAMIRRGAVHFDLVCARCHASPDRPDQGDRLALSPPAPKLYLRLADWPPEALFPVVRDGVPNSGMPAWPSPHRDDEVWAMVAFLTVLPELDATGYRSLARRDVDITSVAPAMASCVRCHGADGRGTPDQAFPRLDIQTPDYLADALTAFRDGGRASGFMQSAAIDLSDADILDLASRFGKGPPPTHPTAPPGHPTAPPGHPTAPPALPTAAPALVSQGSPDRLIPPCAGCHDPGVGGRPAFPRLSGQYEPYLMAQLRLFAAEDFVRGGGPFSDLMRHAGQKLGEADMVQAADWFSKQSAFPERPDPEGVP